MNGISRRELLSEGTSRFVPRGMFSSSHFPIGLRCGSFSAQTCAGTTTKDLLVPMCWGPSVSERRRISERRAFASATVHTRWGFGLRTTGTPMMTNIDYINLFLKACSEQAQLMETAITPPTVSTMAASLAARILPSSGSSSTRETPRLSAIPRMKTKRGRTAMTVTTRETGPE